MINLLRTGASEGELIRILESTSRQPLLPPLGAAEWRRAGSHPVIQNWMRPLRARAEEERLEPLPPLTEELYADFQRTGQRFPFEKPYFERRRRLARAAISALVDGDASGGTWIDSLKDKLTAIADEVSWALPGHVATLSGIDPMLIDLFAAETANLMAEMLNVFGAVLPQDLQTRIRERLRVQIFENYLARYGEFWWTLDWCSNNWNAVCHQGVIGAALAIEDNAERLAKMLLLMAKSLPVYLGGFGDDGACSEGPTYWDYGFGWFSVLNEQLEKRTAGELSLVKGDEHIHQIARYGPRASLPWFNFANFSDAAPGGILRPATLAYLGHRLDDESCRLRACANYRYLAENGLELDCERQDFFNLARLFLYCPPDLSPRPDIPPEDFFFRDLGVVLAHGGDRSGAWWDFAAKAGHNDEHHNHNDCGSYILNINGNRVISEIGAPEYVKDFFSERRYEFLAARTLGHSLPVINGHEQAAGKEFKSSVAACELSASETRFSVDATQCYPPASGCTSFIRHFHFDKAAGGLEVRDEFELASACPVETAIVTEHPVTLCGGVAEIKTDGATVRITPLGDAIVDRVEIHGYNMHDGKPGEIKRLIVIPSRTDRRLTLGYSVTLAHGE